MARVPAPAACRVNEAGRATGSIAVCVVLTPCAEWAYQVDRAVGPARPGAVVRHRVVHTACRQRGDCLVEQRFDLLAAARVDRPLQSGAVDPSGSKAGGLARVRDEREVARPRPHVQRLKVRIAVDTSGGEAAEQRERWPHPSRESRSSLGLASPRSLAPRRSRRARVGPRCVRTRGTHCCWRYLATAGCFCEPTRVDGMHLCDSTASL